MPPSTSPLLAGTGTAKEFGLECANCGLQHGSGKLTFSTPSERPVAERGLTAMVDSCAGGVRPLAFAPRVVRHAPMRMSGRTVLITGGTTGIGRALAAQLLQLGNTVVITGRTEARLGEAREALPGVHAYACDQADPDAVTRLRGEVTGAFPALDVLVNNAGVGPKRDLTDPATLEGLEREIRTNLIGPVQMVGHLLPHLLQRSEAMIVNVTSGLAYVPLALKPVYCATKAAMHSYTKSLRAQLAGTAVKVVELAPPAVATEFNRGQEEMNHGPRMEVDVLARAALRGMEAGREEILPGLARVLRTMARLRPHAVLRAAEAERMVAARCARATVP